MRLLCLITLSCMLLFAGCQTVTTEEPSEENLSKEQEIANDIEILIDALALPRARLEVICARLIAHGADAVPELQKNIDNRIPIVRALSIYCLGQIYQQKKVSEILKLKPQFLLRLGDPVQKVQLEAAAALGIMKEYRGIQLLIDALNHERAYIRMNAAQALFDIFNLTFEYRYDSGEQERKQSAAKWQDWWLKSKDTMLAG